MKTNIAAIQESVDYIENHLEDKLDLNSICMAAGYSKYHLNRMFSSIVGFSIHTYIRRRRLTEAARMLIFTDRPIMEISLYAGYETQQSFTVGFKALFKCSPQAFRKKKDFYPFQLKFTVDGVEKLRGDKAMDIRSADSGEIYLIGYQKNTRLGFHVIGQCWRELHKHKHTIPNRKNTDFLIGLNDYTGWDMDEEKQPAFDYYAASEVDKAGAAPKGMEARTLPASRYIIFQFKAKREDSLQPVTDYIYKEWFPQSSCVLNEHARYDFARYGEETGADGKSIIEFWVPIL